MLTKFGIFIGLTLSFTISLADVTVHNRCSVYKDGFTFTLAASYLSSYRDNCNIQVTNQTKPNQTVTVKTPAQCSLEMWENPYWHYDNGKTCSNISQNANVCFIDSDNNSSVVDALLKVDNQVGEGYKKCVCTTNC